MAVSLLSSWGREGGPGLSEARRDPGGVGCLQAGQAGTSLLVGDRWRERNWLRAAWQGCVERSRLASPLGRSVGGVAERGAWWGLSLIEDPAAMKFLENLAKDPLMPSE